MHVSGNFNYTKLFVIVGTTLVLMTLFDELFDYLKNKQPRFDVSEISYLYSVSSERCSGNKACMENFCLSTNRFPTEVCTRMNPQEGSGM